MKVTNILRIVQACDVNTYIYIVTPPMATLHITTYSDGYILIAYGSRFTMNRKLKHIYIYTEFDTYDIAEGGVRKWTDEEEWEEIPMTEWEKVFAEAKRIRLFDE